MAENSDPELGNPEILAEGVKPEDAIKFWQDKASLTWDKAKELSDAARARAFYVTGLLQQDLVNLVSEALKKALEDGETLEDFKKRITGAIDKQGWHGYRIENIFRTNIQTAYAAGRYVKMREVRKELPYWQYVAILDKRTRPSHAVLDGLVYPVDHEFWNSNYPPNGFRCRCGVRALSQRMLDREKLDVQTEMPKPQIWHDPKTGKDHYVQFPGAEKGFGNNPAKEWCDGSKEVLSSYCKRLENDNYDVAATSLKNFVKNEFENWSKKLVGNFPICVIPKKDAESLGANLHVVVISPATYAKQNAHHPELTLKDYMLAQEAVEKGEKIRQDERNLVYVFNKSAGVVIIVKATTAGDELYLTSLRRMSRDPADREKVVQRLRKRVKKETDGGA